MTAAVETWAPLHQIAPPRAVTHGDIAADVGRDLGLAPDEPQRWLLDAIFAEDADGLPASGDVAVVGPRQSTGKTATLEVAALTDLFVFGVELAVWTAHEFKTARKTFEHMRARILANPDYAARAGFRDSHGEEAIFLATGERLEFHARSTGSGRGFTTSRITLDEALFLQPGDLGALVPTLLTMPDAQVRYGSSAGLAKSAVLRALRDRGRNPGPGEDLAYIEFGAPRRACVEDRCPHAVGFPGCALDDRALWWAANSGLWCGRIGEAAIERQRRMLAMVPLEFSREFLSWWEEPGAADAFGPGRWEGCAGGGPPADLEPAALAVAVSYDLTRAGIVAAGVDGDDVAHVRPLQHGPGTGWLVDRARQLAARFGVEVAIDGNGPAADLIDDLQTAGVPLRVLGSSEVLDACAGIWKRVQERRLSHAAYPELDDAAAAAVKRSVGDRWAWGRKASDADISTLEAATLAVWLAGEGAGVQFF